MPSCATRRDAKVSHDESLEPGGVVGRKYASYVIVTMFWHERRTTKVQQRLIGMWEVVIFRQILTAECCSLKPFFTAALFIGLAEPVAICSFNAYCFEDCYS